MSKLNHSRYLDYGAKKTGQRAYEIAKTTPTYKQKNFYTKLFAMCKEHEIDTDVGFYTRTRADYALAIDRLIRRLRENGIDIKGNNKDAGLMLILKEDGETQERIVVTGEQAERKDTCSTCGHFEKRSNTGGYCYKYETFRDNALHCTDWEEIKEEKQ